MVTRGVCAALVTLVLGACGTSAGPADDAADPAADPVATGTTTPSEPSETPDEPVSPSSAPSEEPVLSCVAGITEIPGTPQQDAAIDAFCTMAELVRSEVFSRAFLPGEAPVPEDYAGAVPYLTDAARQRWDEAVTAWVDREARWAGDLLSGLVLHDATAAVPDGYVIDPDGPYSYDTEIAEPRATSGESGGLSLRVTVTSNLVLDEQGDDTDRHSLLPVTREATYTLVRGGPSDGWLLDDWQAHDTYGEVRLVTG